MPKPLVIVESPAKAKTIAGFLGRDYVVESSIGHIRDLPRAAADVPAAYKGEAWARLGVDVENDFKPLYVVTVDKKGQVKKLKGLLKDASELYLATDEDREGESIAWHLIEVLNPRVPVKRMVFHEITRPAIEQAVENWRELDRRLVDAQEARRILDRLYGYELSPVLWKKVMPRLSAGRVQSVATRMIVERERARIRFRAGTWWDLESRFSEGSQSFSATLSSLDGRRLASGRDFSEAGEIDDSAGVVLLGEEQARDLAARLAGSDFSVRSVEEKPFRRSPHPPFMTSTLQQEAGRKLRFGSRRTMQVAQRLYEHGYITYMRTDSTSLSETAVRAAREQARELYGPDYVPESPRTYNRKVKNAQEAHEAIRPAGDSFRTPDQVARELSDDELRLYELVWKRTVASQMSDATGTSAQVRLAGFAAPPGSSRRGEEAEFSASGKVISFPGFLRAYVEGSDDPEAELEDQEVRLPPLSAGQPVDAEEIRPQGHSTQPPARYTEASLVKAMEEMGVGRPSTYATIVATIQDRGYVWKKGTALVPSFVAFAVVGLLERYFYDLVDYGFTASMEDDLDEIAEGHEEAVPWLTRFYFGNGTPGLKPTIAGHLSDIDAREVNSIPIGADAEGREIVVRVGRYGPYVQRGEERASVPEDLPPDELTVERAEALLAAPSEDRVVGTDPETGLPVLVRAGRFGPYVQLGEGDPGSKEKPRTASVLSGMDAATLGLEDALKLLSLPRVVGHDPGTGEEILAMNGRYGPYLKKGSDSRSLPSEEQLFSMDLEGALALFAQPKQARGRRPAAPPLKDLGPDPATGSTMLVKDGRFGPYVTDGEVNVSLRRGDDVETIDAERAAELLAEKRAAGPPPRRRRTSAAGAAKSARATKAAKAGKAAETASTDGTAKATGSRRTGTKKAGTKKAGTKKAGTKAPAVTKGASRSTTGLRLLRGGDASGDGSAPPS
jgi:DNA topoisomerase-1